MIRTAQAKLILPPHADIDQSLGSVLHGYMMDVIDASTADELHAQEVRPYSQHVFQRDGQWYWEIHTLTDETFEKVLKPILQRDAFLSRQKGYAIGFKDFAVTEEIDYRDLEERFWLEPERPYKVRLQFVTSTSFKSEGKYAIFPLPSLLFHSLIRKWNLFSDASILAEDHLAEHLEQCFSIVNYSLFMRSFSVEGRWIDAFQGRLTLGRFRHDNASRLIALLAQYAVYAGMGIKTALGMGAVHTDVQYRKDVTS